MYPHRAVLLFEEKEESEELAAGVGGDVRSLARCGFSLADSGLYQDVVDEGCEIEHGARVRVRARVSVRTAVTQVSLGSAEGGGQSLFT
jgi:hypothetical protein